MPLTSITMSSTVLKRILLRCHVTFHGSSGFRLCASHQQVRRQQGFCTVPTSGISVFCERNAVRKSYVLQLSCPTKTVYEQKGAYYTVPVRGMAGHSKWQNIRHIKAANDAQKAATNDRYCRMIRAVIKEGGNPDPNLNSKLGQIVNQAMKQNVPKATIETAIKSSLKSKDALEPATVEVKGPGGCFLIIELLSDNVVRSKQQIRNILNKTRSSMLTGGGGIRHFFEHRGIINVLPEKGLSFEKATDDAIEAGAEDIRQEVDENDTSVFQFLTDPMDFYKVVKNLEAMNYNIHSSAVKYLPNVKHTMKDEDIAITEKLFDLLESVPEIVNIYDNIE